MKNGNQFLNAENEDQEQENSFGISEYQRKLKFRVYFWVVELISSTNSSFFRLSLPPQLDNFNAHLLFDEEKETECKQCVNVERTNSVAAIGIRNDIEQSANKAIGAYTLWMLLAII